MGKKYVVYNNTLWEPIKTFDYTGMREQFSLNPGTYLFVANGAKGGDAAWNPYRSYGGTTYGIMDLNHQQTFYVAVGGNGENATYGRNTGARPLGGYNGGGNAGLATSDAYYNGTGGGGATDIRLSDNEAYVPEVPKIHRVPDGYDQVSYINADLRQCILIDYEMKTNTRLEMLAYSNPDGTSASSDVSSEILFAAGGGGLPDSSRFMWQLKRGDVSNKNMYFVYGTDNRLIGSNGEWSYYDIMKISLENDLGESHYTDESMYKNSNGSTSLTPASSKLCIFGQYNESTDEYLNKCKAAVLYTKIFEGSNLVKWLVPYCKHATDGESIDVSSITWQNKYYDDTLTTQYMHIQDYIPIDATCEGIRVHLTLDGADDFIIRIDYYDQDYVQIPNISDDIKISYMPMGNYQGSSRKLAVDIGNNINIYPPFSNARYVRMAIYHPTIPLDASMVDEFSMTYLTYEDGFEAGLYDLIEGKKYHCTTPHNKFYYGNPVTKTQWQSRYLNTKYIKMVIHRNRSNTQYLQMTYLSYKDQNGATIPVTSATAIKSDGSVVTYTNASQTVDQLLIEDTSGKMCTANWWSNNGLDMVITYELTDPIRSDFIRSYAIMTGNDNSGRDPYEWEIFFSPDNVNWYPADRRLNALTDSRNTVTNMSIYQQDAPFNLSLYSRILVAGGGGGASAQYNTTSVQDFLGFGGGSMSSWVACNGGNSSNNAYISPTQTTGNAFGIGGNAEDRSTSGSSSWGMEGQAGGGGGWYGGYAVKGKTAASNSYSSCNGSGGTSYVLTDSSYKPKWYMRDMDITLSDYYFRDFLMLPYQAFDGPGLTIYKEMAIPPSTGDTITIPYTGEEQELSLIPGLYRIKCYGGDGGVRYSTSEHGVGGYAEGVLDLPHPETLYAHVGSSAFLTGIATSSANKDTIFANRVSYQAAVGEYDQNKKGGRAGGGATDVRLISDVKIYPIDQTVPMRYNQYEYIQNIGTSFAAFNTGYVPKTNTNVECICYITNNGNEGIAPFGSQRDGFTLYYHYYGQKAVFSANNERYESSSQPPFNRKVRIVINGNTAYIYDMEDDDTLLMTITATNGKMDCTYPMMIFDTGSPTGGADGAVCQMRLYSFKIFEDDDLKYWFVPYNEGLWDLVENTGYQISGIASDAFGPVKEVKDAYTTYGTRADDSLLSRIIVAGGAGGQGTYSSSTIGSIVAGHGGGESGTSYSGGSGGTNNGPGTQTGTPAQANCGGGFGYAGVGSIYSSNGYGGCGGNGWFGGNGTYTTTNSDNAKGGSGGSGYVLTQESYKPDGYIPDRTYWMSETVLKTKGNPTMGMTKIDIEAVKVSAVLVIAQDAYSYKKYNIDTDTWEDVVISDLTPTEFLEKGAYIGTIKSDTGLLSPYKLYMYDVYDIGVDKLKLNVIPLMQPIKFSEHTNSEIIDETFDADCDEDTTIEMKYTVTGAAENRKLNIELDFDMNEIPILNNTVYIVQFNIRKKPTSHYYPTKPEKHIDDLDLLYVGNTNNVPYRYKTHIGGFMPDGTTAISTVRNSSSCEYKRNIYTASLLNDSIIRFTRYNVIENTAYVIRDNIPRNQVDGDNTNSTCGSLLVDDEYMYLFNSQNNNTGKYVRCLRVPLDPEKAYSAYTAPSDAAYSMGSFGKAYWYSSNQIIVNGNRGHIIFNTKTLNFTSKPDTDTSGGNRKDFAVGKYTILTFWNDATNEGPRYYDRETVARVTPSDPYTFPAGKKAICYDNGLFYITMPYHLYIFRDTPDHNLALVQDILTPYTTLIPKTISYSAGLIYVTIESNATLYIYSIENDRWISTNLPFTEGALSATEFHRPACFKGFFFIGQLKLYVTNYNTYAKYRFGQKNNILMIQTNDNFEGTYLYDHRFITVDGSGINFHTGDIEKHVESIGTRIYMSDEINKDSEYKRIIEYNFSVREEEDDSNG